MTQSNEEKKRPALLLIDFQRDFLDAGGKMPVAQNQVEPVLEAAHTCMQCFLSLGLPIVAVGNEFRRTDYVMNLIRRFASVEGTPGCAWDKRLPLADAQYFPKWGGSAFGNPALEPWLQQNRVNSLVVTGLMAEACVSATARGALKRGFEVATVDEAIASRSERSREKALAHLHARGVGRIHLNALKTQLA